MARSFRRRGRGFKVTLGPDDRAVLGSLCEQLRARLLSDDSSDPALVRLFPAAYPDDPLRSLEFEHTAGGGLLDERLEGIETMEATLGSETLTEEQLSAWLAVVNASRIVFGTRLGITEETTQGDFAADPDARGTFDLYRYLTWLEAEIVEVLPV